MRVFITGASGFIGTELTKNLLAAGHSVLGLARSEASANSLAALGADVQRGSIEDLESLKTGVLAADAAVHLAFNHDFSRFADSCKDDERAILAMGEVLAGTKKPFIVSSGLASLASKPGRLPDEEDPFVEHHLPRVSESVGLKLIERGVQAAVVRLPQVHNEEKQGLITYMVSLAAEKGVSAYVAEGANKFAAVNVVDCAELYRLALEKHRTGARYHAIAESGVSFKDIAETIGQRLNVPVRSISPEEASGHFGWLAMFAGLDLVGSSDLTQKELGWKPTGADLLSDLRGLQMAHSI